MNPALLNEFLAEECDEAIRAKLLCEIRDLRGSEAVREHTFNRFNVRLNFGTREAVIEDELNVSEEGEYTLKVDEFEKALLGANSAH